MNRKRVELHIEKKVDDWMKHSNLPSYIKDEVIITGGCIVSLLTDQEVNDYDMYFLHLATVEALAKKYADLFQASPPTELLNEIGEAPEVKVVATDKRVYLDIKIKDDPFKGLVSEDFSILLKKMLHDRTPTEDKPKYRPVYCSKNAITLSDKMQIILRFYGDANEIHKNFDFTHCKGYWTNQTGLVLPEDTLACILTKELVYSGSLYPLASIFRTRKFIQRGWNINVGQYVKMALQLQGMDLTNKEVLAEQLTGVDSALWEGVIKQMMESGDTQVVVDELFDIIDEVF